MAIKPVCKDCERRNPGCHSSCQDYISYRKKLEEFNAKVKKEKEKNAFTATWSNSTRKRIIGR